MSLLLLLRPPRGYIDPPGSGTPPRLIIGTPTVELTTAVPAPRLTVSAPRPR